METLRTKIIYGALLSAFLWTGLSHADNCYVDCREKGNSKNYCEAVCGGGNCYADCRANGNSKNYCDAICGGTDCYTDCRANGNSKNYCDAICGNASNTSPAASLLCALNR